MNLKIIVIFSSKFYQILQKVEEGSKWDNHPSFPWINWNMGGIGQPRVKNLANTTLLGRTLLMLSFPGTITLYYGDEVDVFATKDLLKKVISCFH